MCVNVILCSRNGEKYLRAQIESILKQTEQSVRLLISDDVSSDRTQEIEREYAEQYPERVKVRFRTVPSGGAARHFFLALQYFAEETGDGSLSPSGQSPSGQYYMFADQDDVWKPEKLSAASQKLAELPANNRGKLYYSNKSFVDQNLNLIREENIVFYDDFFEVLWKNLASGCTMVFDRALAGYALKHRPQTDCIHDNWIYRIAKAIGSTVIFDSDSYILYRQHGNNEVGIEGAKLYHSSVSYMLKRAVPLLFQKRDHKRILYLKEIYDLYRSDMVEENAKLIDTFLHYRFSPVNKWKLIHHPDMKKRDRKSRVVWWYSIVFNRL